MRLQNAHPTGKMISRASPPSSWPGMIWIGALGLLVVTVGLFVAARILFSPQEQRLDKLPEP